MPGLVNIPVRPSAQVKETPRIKTASRTPSLASLLKAEVKTGALTTEPAPETDAGEPYTEEQLREVWNAWTEQRRKFQAEYQMLSQPYRLEGHTIVVALMSPVHENMLNNIKGELTSFLREKLKNSAIVVSGQVQALEDQKIIYTNREKFEFLAKKNPMLKELKDRLGLDTDF